MPVQNFRSTTCVCERRSSSREGKLTLKVSLDPSPVYLIDIGTETLLLCRLLDDFLESFLSCMIDLMYVNQREIGQTLSFPHSSSPVLFSVKIVQIMLYLRMYNSFDTPSQLSVICLPELVCRLSVSDSREAETKASLAQSKDVAQKLLTRESALQKQESELHQR